MLIDHLFDALFAVPCAYFAGSLFTDRVFIPQKPIRTKLRALFPNGSHIVLARGIKASGANHNELLDIVNSLQHRPALAAVVQHVFHNRAPGEVFMHKYLLIIWTLALDSPVCQTLKPHIRDIIKVQY